MVIKNKARTLMVAVALFGLCSATHAGNEDRAGSSGASQLLLNPWARSSGLGGANAASVVGIESLNLNVAGMAFTEKTELLFTRTQWFAGAGVNLNTLGFSQRIGDGSVLGVSVMNISFGDIPITTENLPDGDGSTFAPSYNVISAAFAKEFSNSIYGGITFKLLSESISNASAQGFCFDAGVRYVTGETDNIKFGISLQNVGPTMTYRGDGLSAVATFDAGNPYELTLEQRSQQFELPSLLNVAASYRFDLSELHRIEASANFVSNSFTSDQFRLGAEYNYKEYLKLRAGYSIEQGALSANEDLLSAHTGLSGGLSLEIPTGSNGSTIGLDYSYRVTKYFDGIHSIGARINLK